MQRTLRIIPRLSKNTPKNTTLDHGLEAAWVQKYDLLRSMDVDLLQPKRVHNFFLLLMPAA